MSPRGGCPCGAARFAVHGPVRDVIVCHCDACQAAAGGPWAAAAARRGDLVLEDAGALRWVAAEVSAHGASRGFCGSCGTYLLWDAPGRETVSFGAELLDDGAAGLEVAAHIWVPADEQERARAGGIPVYAEGLPRGTSVAWHDETRATG